MDTISAQGSSHKKKDKEKASTDLKAGGGGGGGGVEGSRDEVVLPTTWRHFVPGSPSPLHPGRLHRCLVLQGAQVVPGVQDERTEREEKS